MGDVVEAEEENEADDDEEDEDRFALEVSFSPHPSFPPSLPSSSLLPPSSPPPPPPRATLVHSLRFHMNILTAGVKRVSMAVCADVKLSVPTLSAVTFTT